MATHTHSFEYFCRVRTCTDRTRFTSAVVLTVSSLTYSTKSMSFNYTLEAFTFRSTNNVNISRIIEQLHCNSVSQIQFCFKIFELGQVSLRSYTSFFKVPHQRFGSMLFLFVLETYLNSCIAVFLNTLNLSNYTRTSFDNSAWYIFTISTENGCHSDFLS